MEISENTQIKNLKENNTSKNNTSSSTSNIIGKDSGRIKCKIILLGQSNVGKTHLLYALCDENFNCQINTTIGADFRIKLFNFHGQSYELRIWDTAGQERFKTTTCQYIRGAEYLLLIYDITSRYTLEELNYYFKKYLELSKIRDGSNVILIGNKSDRHEDRQISYKEGKDYARDHNIKHFFECSSKTGYNMQEIFESIVKIVTKSQDLYEIDDEILDPKNYYKESFVKMMDMCEQLFLKIFLNEDGKFIDIIKNFYNKHIKKLSDFENFVNFIATFNELTKIKTNIFNYIDILSSKFSINDKNSDIEKLIGVLIFLGDSVSSSIYEYQIIYLKNVAMPIEVDYRNLKKTRQEILFSNFSNILTASMKTRKKQLLGYFHPDFISYQNKHDLNIFLTYKKIVEEIYDEVENKFNENIELEKERGEVEFYANLAYKYWSIAIGYQNAIKKEYNKLGQYLKFDDINNMPEDQLNDLKIKNALLAYENFKGAFKAADKNEKFLNDQIKFRAEAALANYVAKNFLKSNLYILASYYIIYNKGLSNILDKNTVSFVNQRSDKISKSQYVNSNIQNPQTTTDSSSNEVKNNSEDNQQSTCLVALNTHLDSIKISKYYELDQILIRHRNNIILRESDLQELKEKIYKNIYLCLTYAEGELIENKMKKFSLVSKINRSFSNYLKWLILPGLIVFGVVKLFDKISLSQQKKNLQQVCNKISSIINDSLKCYNDQNYELFFETLSLEYETGKSLITLNDGIVSINPNEISKFLISFEFKPHQICLILNIMACSLLNGSKIFCEDALSSRNLATSIFKEVLSDKFEKYAEEIDNNYLNIVNSYTTNKKSVYEIPYRINLEEMRNIARVNLAIINLLVNYKKSIEYIKQIEESLIKFHLLQVNDSVDIFKDLLTCLNLNEEKEEEKIKTKDLDLGYKDNLFLCFPIEFDVNNDMLKYLCILSRGKINLDIYQLINEFEGYYNSKLIHDEIITEIFKIEKVNDLLEFKKKLIENSSISFSIPYLKLFSKLFNLNFFFYKIGIYKGKYCFIYDKFKSIIAGQNFESINLVYENNFEIKSGFIRFENSYIKFENISSRNNQEKFEYFVKLANEYYIHAKNLEEFSGSKIESKNYFNLSANFFTRALEINNLQEKEIYNLSNCLIKIGRPGEAINLLKTTIKNIDEVCYENILKANRKLKNFEQIENVFNKLPNNILSSQLIKKEKEISDGTNFKFCNKIYNYYKQETLFEGNLKYNDTYKILILKGGIEEIVLLCELEKRLKKRIYQLFNLICGYNKGSITASLLTKPIYPEFTTKEFIKPYTAFELLKIYKDIENNNFSSNVLLKYFDKTPMEKNLSYLILINFDNDNLITFHTGIESNQIEYTDAILKCLQNNITKSSIDLIKENYPINYSVKHAIQKGVDKNNLFILNLAGRILIDDSNENLKDIQNQLSFEKNFQLHLIYRFGIKYQKLEIDSLESNTLNNWIDEDGQIRNYNPIILAREKILEENSKWQIILDSFK